uniref:Pectinesterase inhibitor domain-containing protein n=1 Tax=Fagus sylvatica TaxID=28930 RepID=A0A2N9ISU4_FAGSY
MKEIVPSFCASSSLLISLLLAFLCISPTQSRLVVKITDDVLNDICSRTEDPSSCLQALKSDPRTATTDFYGLAQVSINLANATVNETHTMIMSQLDQTMDPKLQDQYTQCLEFYDNAIGDIEYGSENWSSKDYLALDAASSACMTDIIDLQRRDN